MMRTNKIIALATVTVSLLTFSFSADAQVRVRPQTGGGTSPTSPTSFNAFTAPSNAPVAVREAVARSNSAMQNLNSRTVTIGGQSRPAITEAQINAMVNGTTRNGVVVPPMVDRITALSSAGNLNSDSLASLISEYVSAATEVNLMNVRNASLVNAISESLTAARQEVNTPQLDLIDEAAGVLSVGASSRADASTNTVECGLLSMVQGSVAAGAGPSNLQNTDLRASNSAQLKSLYQSARALNEARIARGLPPVTLEVEAFSKVNGETVSFKATGSEESLQAFFTGAAEKLETGELAGVSLMIVEAGNKILSGGSFMNLNSESDLWFAMMDDLKSQLAAIVGETQATRIVFGDNGQRDFNGGIAGECPINFGFQKRAA